jgi:hypothetical protein
MRSLASAIGLSPRRLRVNQHALQSRDSRLDGRELDGEVVHRDL